MATISKDPVENLSNLALFIANDVRSTMTASLVTSIANAWFHQFARAEQEKRFRTHPANNIVYAGLKAHRQRFATSTRSRTGRRQLASTRQYSAGLLSSRVAYYAWLDIIATCP